MYKVFDSKSQIIFSQNKIGSSYIVVKEISDLEHHNSNGDFYFNHVSLDPLKSMQQWFSEYQFIDASGGLVECEKDFLWILRNGIWDLPKGKLEKGEDFKTAGIREVQEECGLDKNLSIIHLLHISFHTYAQNSTHFLKRTHWYKMKYFGNKKLTPQIEEGIEDVKWLNFENSALKTKKSFGSIGDVWTSFLKT
jgi:ADP-ribose pyrophosphatase YjhB (NUDIX family)